MTLLDGLLGIQQSSHMFILRPSPTLQMCPFLKVWIGFVHAFSFYFVGKNASCVHEGKGVFDYLHRFPHLHTCPSWVWLSICRQKINICMLIGCLHVLSLHRSDASIHHVWLLALYVLTRVHVVWLHTSIELCSPCTLLGELTNTTTPYTRSQRAHQRHNTAMTMN